MLFSFQPEVFEIIVTWNNNNAYRLLKEKV